MAIRDITLQHTLVNSGTAVNLKGASVSYKWKNITNFTPSVGKFDITPGNYHGFENPTISITGTISTIDLGDDDLTQEHLVNFCTLLSTIPIVLTIPTSSSGSTELPFPSTPIYLGGRPSGGYETDGTNNLSDSIKVWITDFSIDFDNGSEMGHIWTYKINLQEAL